MKLENFFRNFWNPTPEQRTQDSQTRSDRSVKLPPKPVREQEETVSISNRNREQSRTSVSDRLATVIINITEPPSRIERHGIGEEAPLPEFSTSLSDGQLDRLHRQQQRRNTFEMLDSVRVPEEDRVENMIGDRHAPRRRPEESFTVDPRDVRYSITEFVSEESVSDESEFVVLLGDNESGSPRPSVRSKGTGPDELSHTLVIDRPDELSHTLVNNGPEVHPLTVVDNVRDELSVKVVNNRPEEHTITVVNNGPVEHSDKYDDQSTQL
jgi:hypothetical protein